MKHHGKIWKLSIAFWLVLLSAVFAKEVNQISEARETVELFCKAEFEGDEFGKRVKLVKFSSERAKKEKGRDPDTHGRVIYWDETPLFIVESFQVLNIELKGNIGVVSVVYKRIGQSEGKGKVISDYKEQDIVKLGIVNDSNQWWILDPPIPRLSKKALIDYYNNRLKFLGDKWIENPSLSETQKNYYYQMQEALKVLKELNNHE